jgi:hypothetical protein
VVGIISSYRREHPSRHYYYIFISILLFKYCIIALRLKEDVQKKLGLLAKLRTNVTFPVQQPVELSEFMRFCRSAGAKVKPCRAENFSDSDRRDVKAQEKNRKFLRSIK